MAHKAYNVPGNLDNVHERPCSEQETVSDLLDSPQGGGYASVDGSAAVNGETDGEVDEHRGT